MIKKIDSPTMGGNNYSWLKTKFHFSFDNYYNPKNMNFGILRVLNDDLIHAKTGFEMHPHKDMEIVTYVVSGELTHQDSFNNKSTLSKGHVQFISAGTGIYHSEHNFSDQLLHSLQIWILQEEKVHTPNNGEYKNNWEERENKWLHIVSSKSGPAQIKINQDVNIYVSTLDQNHSLEFDILENRQAYLVQIEGSSKINGVTLNEQDAIEVTEEKIIIQPTTYSHYILLEMKKV